MFFCLFYLVHLPDQDGLRALEQLQDGLGVRRDDLQVERQGETSEPVQRKLQPGELNEKMQKHEIRSQM